MAWQQPPADQQPGQRQFAHTFCVKTKLLLILENEHSVRFYNRWSMYKVVTALQCPMCSAASMAPAPKVVAHSFIPMPSSFAATEDCSRLPALSRCPGDQLT